MSTADNIGMAIEMVRRIANKPASTAGEVAGVIIRSSDGCARGSSGVITSQLSVGFTSYPGRKDELTGQDWPLAFQSGVEVLL